jgi:diguanylate cyclase
MAGGRAASRVEEHVSDSAGVLLAVAREVFAELKSRQLDPSPRNFGAVCDEVCARLGVVAVVAGEERADLRAGKDAHLELVELLQVCVDFIGRLVSDRLEMTAALGRVRAELAASDPHRLRAAREELTARVRTFEAEPSAAHEKSVMRGLLRSLADYLASASGGSQVFATRVDEVRRKVEQASTVNELRALQILLGDAAATAVREAQAMRGELDRLNNQVSWSTRQINTLEQALVESRRAMHVDPLTHIPNRRALDEWLTTQLYDGDRPLRPFSLLVLDLDRFKIVNDNHGHLAGDRVLADAARRLQSGIRDKDFLARYGGEEFVIVLPDCALPIAMAVARRLCVLLERKPVVHQGREIGITASIGVAECHAAEPFRDVFSRADRCLYVAKEQGRNRALGEKELPEGPGTVVAKAATG